jgi:hypothetical protein
MYFVQEEFTLRALKMKHLFHVKRFWHNDIKVLLSNSSSSLGMSGRARLWGCASLMGLVTPILLPII